MWLNQVLNVTQKVFQPLRIAFVTKCWQPLGLSRTGQYGKYLVAFVPGIHGFSPFAGLEGFPEAWTFLPSS